MQIRWRGSWIAMKCRKWCGSSCVTTTARAWQSSWDSQTQGRLPVAVEMRFEVQVADPAERDAHGRRGDRTRGCVDVTLGAGTCRCRRKSPRRRRRRTRRQLLGEGGSGRDSLLSLCGIPRGEGQAVTVGPRSGAAAPGGAGTSGQACGSGGSMRVTRHNPTSTQRRTALRRVPLAPPVCLAWQDRHWHWHWQSQWHPCAAVGRGADS